MIWKTDKYQHLYFNEHPVDDPRAVLACVELLFAEIAQMEMLNCSKNVYMRCPPKIEYENQFEGGRVVNVFCRMSVEL